MNIEFVELKLRNFLSFGNVEQSIKLNKDACTLITGLNKDKSSEDESEKNGVGRQAFLQQFITPFLEEQLVVKLHYLI